MANIVNISEDIRNIKSNIKNTLVNKGQTVNISDPLSSYANKIMNISPVLPNNAIYQFDNMAQMNNFQYKAIGDTALVIDRNSLNLKGLYEYNGEEYTPAETQYNASIDGVLLGTFYGMNGVEEGQFINTVYYNNETRLEIYPRISRLLTLYYAINCTNVTNLSTAFYNNQDLVFCPNLITSNNLVNTETMFGECYNLMYVHSFNTLCVTDTAYMFAHCFNLSSISYFNMNNAINAFGMMAGCTNLTAVPNLNFINATATNDMFWECTNLRGVPNMDFSNTLNSSRMFSLCYNIVDIPQFNMVNTKNMVKFAECCNNLSNISVHNIINICLNSNITLTTRKNLNTVNQFSPFYNTIFNSSYYSNRLSELTSAGWKY